MLKRLLLTLAYTLVLLAPISGSRVLASATPVAREAVPASECTVEPRKLDALLIGATTPNAPDFHVYDGVGTPEPWTPGPTPTPLPADQPADAQTIAEIEAAARDFVACINTDEPLRYWAMYTDAIFQRGSIWIDYGELTQPDPSPVFSEKIALLDVSYVRSYDDGRVGAVLSIGGLTDGSVEPLYLIFARVGNRWLIDDIPTFLVGETETEESSGSVIDCEGDDCSDYGFATLVPSRSESSATPRPGG